MKKTLVFIVFGIVAAASLYAAVPREITGIEGTWLGTLDAMGTKLRLAFHFTTEEDGALKATMDSLDQGAKGIGVDSVVFENNTLNLEIQRLRVQYEAELSEDGTELSGTFKQAGMSFPLILKRVDELPQTEKPQDPKKPYPYLEEEVTYKNSEDGITLAGTLTRPKEGGPFPAVILITGSGAQNRNEEVFGHRPFLVLADHLTRKGLAVLRSDDRGVGGSTGNLSDATTEDLAADILAGIALLKSRNDMDPARIGLIGHSEGGIIAPIAAVRAPDVAFIVLMAGTGLTGEEILYLQSALIQKASGVSEAKIAENRADQEKVYAVLKQDKPVSAMKEELHAMFLKDLASMTDMEKTEMGDNPEAVFEADVSRMLSNWFRFFLTYDPKTALRKVTCPVLALNGEKDLQVPPKENLTAIEAALKEAGNTNVTIKEFPGFNHLFQPAETGNLNEYAKSPITIDPTVLDTISGWILEVIR